MPEEIKTLLSFNDKLHKFAEEKLSSIPDDSDRTFFVAFVITKAFKTHESVLLLCRGGYGEDAFMLTRTLLELMVINSYILKDSTNNLLMRYMNHDWVTRREMYDVIVQNPKLLIELNKKAESDGGANSVSEIGERSNEVTEEYNYQRHRGWSDKNIREMFVDVGREDLYNTVYKLQCILGHSNARSMNEYVHKSDTDPTFNIGPNWDMTRTALVPVFDCFFHIMKEADEQFSWGLDKSLEDLAEEYGNVVGKLKHESSK